MSETLPRETGYLDVAGARLCYEVAGAGHPILLLYADVADSRMWDEQGRRPRAALTRHLSG